MLMKGAAPGTERRCELLQSFLEKEVSFNTTAALAAYMHGKTEKEKEAVAEQLLTIISESSTEEEMLQKALQMFGKTPEEMEEDEDDEEDYDEDEE